MNGIGLFGGTFDPVHCGHLEIAKEAIQLCGLSQVIFLPTSSPPHKNNAKVSVLKHRVAMLSLVVQDKNGISVSTIEEKLPPPNYTIDTIEHFIQENKVIDPLYFIIGADAFLELHTWKTPQKVLDAVHFIIFARQGYSGDILAQYLRDLGYVEERNYWSNEKNEKFIYNLDISISNISSSAVRKRIELKKSHKGLICPSVFRYIKDNRLYI